MAKKKERGKRLAGKAAERKKRLAEKLAGVRPDNVKYILATDVGSTTTKARFFKKIGEDYRYVVSGEAPTTVEAPYEDVTMGAKNAVREVEELTDHKFLHEGGIILPGEEGKGVDLYVTTSSAGGGLQMMVAGVVRSMTAESAERAALGAGAIVMDVIAVDDGRYTYQKIHRIRTLRPDMMLLGGGTDGGNVRHVMEMTEIVRAAEPKPRFGIGFTLPIVYAGNVKIRGRVKDALGEFFTLTVVDNLRPVLEVENTEPARAAIHELFMEHVMSHAPGYNKLMTWTDVPIMPTPAGEGMMMQLIAKVFETNVLGVGLGGATTNLYSIFDEKFVRTVSANLGMSYSICNVMMEATMENIMRWIPFDIEEGDVRNRLRNKMIRPTTIPHTMEELMVEHAVAREALRLGLEHHRALARGLKGVKKKGSLWDASQIKVFEEAEEESYLDMMRISIVAGTGGLLSHAPRRAQSLLILTDAFQPEGVTRIFQDSVFMMPHLGVLSTVHSKAAWDVFDKDCLVRLGTVIAPKGLASPGGRVMRVTLGMPDGSKIVEDLTFGEMKRIDLPEREEASVMIRPTRRFDVGAGPGKILNAKAYGGVVGVVMDARGRPLELPDEDGTRMEKLVEWFSALGLYPKQFLDDMRRELAS